MIEYTVILYKEKNALQKEMEFPSEPLYDAEYFMRAAEAAMFAFGSPISFEKLAKAIGADVKDIPEVLRAMAPKYKDSAIEVLVLDGYAQLSTKNEYADIVRNTLEIRKNMPLSRAALEVLAIIAYNQPVTRTFIDKVRGIESPSVIISLLDKGLIEESGRLDAPGRPILYSTTPAFLRVFGLESVEKLNEIPELALFTKQIAEKRNELMVSEKAESASVQVPGQRSLEGKNDVPTEETQSQ